MNLIESKRDKMLSLVAQWRQSGQTQKDWWVVQTLTAIFSMECANSLIFKSGTSLSKGWNLIQRFSEDIDLVLDKEFLGFSGKLSKGDTRRLRRKSHQFITEFFTEELKNKFTELGFKDLTIKYREVENLDQNPLIIEIYYPTLTTKDSYLKPAVLVEVGSRSLKVDRTSMLTSVTGMLTPSDRSLVE